MESAKSSYRVDLEAGFQIIHIDPSIDIHKTILNKEDKEMSLLHRSSEGYQRPMQKVW